MAWTKIALTMGLLTLLSTAEPAFGEWSISRIASHYGRCVVKVMAMDDRDHPLSSGTGFRVGENGTVATVHHLVQRASRVVVETADGERGEFLEIIGLDAARDLLLARTSLRKAPIVTLGDSHSTYPGEEILVMGHPVRGRVMLSPGEVSGISRLQGIHLFQMSATILPGWSGSPVFNTLGHVIGMAAAFLETGEELSFAIPIHYLAEMGPVSLRPDELPERTTRLEAALRGETLIELLVREKHPLARKTPPAREPHKDAQASASWRALEARGGTVHFRNGRRLKVHRAWREGESVFFVLPGKGFAVGYGAEEILLVEPFPAVP